MDNECVADIKQWLTKTAGITPELTHVSAHRRNRAERAILTWRNHFIAMFVGIDPECTVTMERLHRTGRVDSKPYVRFTVQLDLLSWHPIKLKMPKSSSLEELTRCD